MEGLLLFFFQGTKEANPKQIRDIIAMQIGHPAQRTSASSTPMPHQQQGGQQPLVNGVHTAAAGAPMGNQMPMAAGGMPGPPMHRGSFPMPGGMPQPGQMPHFPGQLPQNAMGMGGTGPTGAAPTAQHIQNKFLQVNSPIFGLKLR